jgi:hypothetical protein
MYLEFPWIPVFTGMTTFYEFIMFDFSIKEESGIGRESYKLAENIKVMPLRNLGERWDYT